MAGTENAFYSSGFWKEKFWLPQGVQWKELANTETKKYGQPEDLAIVVPLAAALFCFRFLVERYVMQPIGRNLKVPEKLRQPPKPNATLEKVFCSVTKHPNEKQIRGLCKQLDWSEREVFRWFRKRNLLGMSTILKKFSETGWRFVFYICSFAYGIYVLYDEECVLNRNKCWSDFPENHGLTTKLYWYYMIELAFYTSTTATQFFDVKRKDFWEMFIHHIATILLLLSSYIMNLTKIGSFIVLVHDSADFLLELAKMGKYAERKRTTSIAFMLFAVAFFLSRLGVYPLWVLPSIWSVGLKKFLPFSALHFQYLFLQILQVLHFYWGYHVAGGVYASLVNGEIKKDTRSEEEPDETDDDSEENQQRSNDSASGDAVANGCK